MRSRSCPCPNCDDSNTDSLKRWRCNKGKYCNCHKCYAYGEAKRKFEELVEMTSPEIASGFLNFIDVIKIGKEKHGNLNWMERTGKKSSEKDMHASMFRHLAESSAEGKKALDKESGLSPLLHLTTRALMLYTRRELGIVHSDDKTEEDK